MAGHFPFWPFTGAATGPEVPLHRCRSKQIFGDAKDFSPNFSKLPEKVLVQLLSTNFLPERDMKTFFV